ncbi:MAG: cytochrome P450 [Cyanobacteria bacterium J06627_28]
MILLPRRTQLNQTKQVPRIPGRGLAGNYQELLSGPAQFYSKAAWQSGGIARFRIYHRDFYAIAHPDLLHEILVTRQKQYVKGEVYRNTSVVIGNGLVTVEGKTWANERKIIQPGFHRKAIAHLIDTIHTACEQTFQKWERNPQDYRDFIPESQVITQQVISETLLGTTLAEMQSVKFAEILTESLRLLPRKNWSLFKTPFSWPTPLNRKLLANRRLIDTFFAEQIEKRRAFGIGKKGDLLDLMLLAHTQETEPTISLERMLDEMLTLFAAGYDTTSSAISWTLYYLCQHPTVEAKVRAEIDTVLGQRQATWADLEKLTFTECALKEALRLAPPLHTIMRTNPEDEELGGYHIPKGSLLMLSLYGVHRSPEHWQNPEAYRPERFLPTAPQPVYERAFIPFSNGARRCMGAMFAMVESKLVLANLMQKFRFSAKPHTQVTVSPASSWSPDQLPIAFYPR